MASISITIPDGEVSRVATAMNITFGVPATQAGVKTAIINFIKTTTHRYEYTASVDAVAQPTDVSPT